MVLSVKCMEYVINLILIFFLITNLYHSIGCAIHITQYTIKNVDKWCVQNVIVYCVPFQTY